MITVSRQKDGIGRWTVTSRTFSGEFATLGDALAHIGKADWRRYSTDLRDYFVTNDDGTLPREEDDNGTMSGMSESNGVQGSLPG